ncbi:MerR family transcriptional regulator [Actinoplanes sp. NEAU-A11]|uniref:MerR family transcriptional regulator n=1 Tax=Actinoplanes aureus TaxID=2792083 RepID=A0A931C7Z4_9ACTN|nr:MerR family transcriptional regulator [Actinoplanes aureus]MBG0561731.1 MerR family transcriptional regulator [Actinoplanes aureus]
MRAIGEVARASGLSVSALRFYDGAGVLVPAAVDRATGYRRYTADQIRAARLIAGLRRVGMPVAEIAEAVQDLENPDSVRRKLDLHLARLEAGLADARREIVRLHSLLDLEDDLTTRLTLPAADLSAVLGAVRFAAAGAGDVIPAGVLFEAVEGVLTVVATDRYRLAVAATPAEVAGAAARIFVPLTFVESLCELRSGSVTLNLTAERVSARAGDLVVEDKPIDIDFPDYRRLLSPAGPETRRVPVDAADLRERLAAAPVVAREHDGSAYRVSILGLDPSGGLHLAAESEWAADATAHVAVNREFLLQALDAGGAGQLVLELDGPFHPLAVRVPGDETRFSILMPVRH